MASFSSPFAKGSRTAVAVRLKMEWTTAKKSDLTGATASLRPDANDASKAVSIDGLLQGKIAGLNVTASMSTPGAASSVTIRGANSLRGDNQPLYVIDNGGKHSRHCSQSEKQNGRNQINKSRHRLHQVENRTKYFLCTRTVCRPHS